MARMQVINFRIVIPKTNKHVVSQIFLFSSLCNLILTILTLLLRNLFLEFQQINLSKGLCDLISVSRMSVSRKGT